MYTKDNITTVSDLRKNTVGVIAEIEKKGEPVIVFSHSKPKLVIMSFEWYKNMKEPQKTKKMNAKSGFDLFINPPEHLLIRTKGISAVDIVRALR